MCVSCCGWQAQEAEEAKDEAYEAKHEAKEGSHVFKRAAAKAPKKDPKHKKPDADVTEDVEAGPVVPAVMAASKLVPQSVLLPLYHPDLFLASGTLIFGGLSSCMLF
jgi:hypothetical protein